MKKSESDSESKDWKAIIAFVDWQKQVIEDLVGRVRHLEVEILALQRGDNTGFRHENDGGYFD